MNFEWKTLGREERRRTEAERATSVPAPCLLGHLGSTRRSTCEGAQDSANRTRQQPARERTPLTRPSFCVWRFRSCAAPLPSHQQILISCKPGCRFLVAWPSQDTVLKCLGFFHPYLSYNSKLSKKHSRRDLSAQHMTLLRGCLHFLSFPHQLR